MDRELSPFTATHFILVWNEVKIRRLKKRQLCRKSSPNVCGGLPSWPKQISFWRESRVNSAQWETNTHAGFSCCQRMCLSEPLLSFSLLQGFCHVALLSGLRTSRTMLVAGLPTVSTYYSLRDYHTHREYPQGPVARFRLISNFKMVTTVMF